MKWYKHDTNALADAKLKKLVMRHGPEGYAVYFHCLELIAGDISSDNITFELEHDAEIIADNLKIKGSKDRSPIDRVQDIMNHIVDLGLFQENNNKIFCLKLAKRIDQSMIKSPQLKQLKQGIDKSMKIIEKSCQTRLDNTRIDKTNIDLIKKCINLIFWYWNRKNIIKHRKLTDQIKHKVKATLKDYSQTELLTAINRYSVIVNSADYFFKYRWTLIDFLQRGLRKFDNDSCFENYKNYGNSGKPVGPIDVDFARILG